SWRRLLRSDRSKRRKSRQRKIRRRLLRADRSQGRSKGQKTDRRCQNGGRREGSRRRKRLARIPLAAGAELDQPAPLLPQELQIRIPALRNVRLKRKSQIRRGP